MHCRKQLQLSNSIDPINRRAVIVGCNSIMFRIYCCNLSKLRDLEINNISSPDEESSRVVAIKQKKLSDTFNRVSTIFAQCIYDLYLLVIKWIEDKSDAYAYMQQYQQKQKTKDVKTIISGIWVVNTTLVNILINRKGDIWSQPNSEG